MASTQTATCRSELPCAITRIFTFAFARELMKLDGSNNEESETDIGVCGKPRRSSAYLADTPLLIAIPSPTIATIAMGESVRLIEFTFDLDSSSSKVDSNAANAALP